MNCIHWRLSAAEKLVVDILRIFVSRQGFRNVQRRSWNQKKPREENYSPNSPVEIGACGSDAEHIEHLSLSVLWRGGIGSEFQNVSFFTLEGEASTVHNHGLQRVQLQTSAYSVPLQSSDKKGKSDELICEIPTTCSPRKNSWDAGTMPIGRFERSHLRTRPCLPCRLRLKYCNNSLTA